MMSSRRLLSVALISMVLLAQLLLAWHLPSHLHDHQTETATSLQSGQPASSNIADNDEPCALGVNGHGVALAATLSTNDSTLTQALRCASSSAHYASINNLLYHARGPPPHS
jgi:hypothetical protein